MESRTAECPYSSSRHHHTTGASRSVNRTGIFALMKACARTHHWSRVLLLYMGLLATTATDGKFLPFARLGMSGSPPPFPPVLYIRKWDFRGASFPLVISHNTNARTSFFGIFSPPF